MFSGRMHRRIHASKPYTKTMVCTACLVILVFSGPAPQLVHEALDAAENSKDPGLRNAVLEIVLNRNLRPDVRAHAMLLAMKHPDQATLLAFAEVLDDTNLVYKREYCPQFSPGYPLAESMTLKTLRPFLENTFSQRANTIVKPHWII